LSRSFPAAYRLHYHVSKLCSKIAESQMEEVPVEGKPFYIDRIYSSGFKFKGLEDSSHKH